MAGLEMEEFERHLESACLKLSFVKSVTLFASTESSNLWKVSLNDDSYIDVYYSEITDKTSFAHIKDKKRILGADNAGGWHWHPRESPDSHVPSASEITIEEFMKELESTFE
jgi:hypothetical protein